MIRLFRVLALALAFFPSLAAAQSLVGRRIVAPEGYLPGVAIYCDNGGGYAALCNFGGGGQGGSTSTTSTAAAPTQVEGASNNPLSTDLSGYLRVRAKQDGAWLMAATQSGSWSIANADFGADCTVVSGDQAYTVGATQRCTMTASGRIKVGLSSAGNIAPAAQLATTTTADLVACKYVAAGVTFADGYTGTISCDAAGRILVNVTGTVTANLGTLNGAATSALQSSMITALGSPMQQTGGTVSLSGYRYQLFGTYGGAGQTASGTGTAVGPVQPNAYIFACSGTIGGGTVTLQVLGPDGATFQTVSGVSFTSLPASIGVVMPNVTGAIGSGSVTAANARAVLTGATSPSVFCSLS